MGDKVKSVETFRRSVTIRPELDERIRDLISACMRHRIDIDYTSALNLFAELGEKWLEDSTREDRERRRNVWSKYLDYDKFEEDAKADWVELQEFRQWKQTKAKLEKSKSDWDFLRVQCAPAG